MPEFTPVLSLVWQIAAIEAADARHEFIEPEHFFIALCKLEGFANVTRLRALGVPESQVPAVEAEIDLLMGLFNRFNVSTTTLRHDLRRHKGTGNFAPLKNEQDREIHRSLESKIAFEQGNRYAQKANTPVLTIFHLLAGLLDDPNSMLVQWLKSKDIKTTELQQSAAITSMPHLNTATPASPWGDKSSARATAVSKNAVPTDRYSREMTQNANPTQLSGMYEDHLQQIARILNKPGKNNPLLLVEEAGLGKQVVERLAWQMTNHVIPAPLADRQIITVNLTELTTNISYQGEFADRLNNLLKNLADSGQKPIVFIEDAGNIIGSGRIHVDMEEVIATLTGGLVEGKIQCIGVTTRQEYNEYITGKPEFKNLFTPIAFDTATTPALPAEPEPPGANPAGSFIRAETPPPDAETGRLLRDLQNRLVKFGVELQVEPEALSLLNRIGATGADSMRKIIAQRVENPLGGMLLRGEIDYGQTVSLDAARNELVFRTVGQSIASRLLNS